MKMGKITEPRIEQCAYCLQTGSLTWLVLHAAYCSKFDSTRCARCGKATSSKEGIYCDDCYDQAVANIVSEFDDE
ncbi:MAG: hypothetical protein QXL94_00150 [Candidatus Parvarchaeum sp.]